MKDSECTSVRQLLALRPADWDENERRRAEEHLAACTQCAELSRAYMAQDRALQTLPAAGLGESARQKLFSRLEREKQPRMVRPRLVWALGAILGVVILVAVALAVNFLVRQGDWGWNAQKNDPTMGPTQVTMPAPTITPTTSLTPTPMGENGWPLATRTYPPGSPSEVSGGRLAGTANSLVAFQTSVGATHTSPRQGPPDLYRNGARPSGVR